MFSILSLVTSVKDYVEIAHKLIETDTTAALKTYSDFGGVITYLVLTGTEWLKDFLTNLISLKWVQSLWSLPIIIPDISSAMISEISILDSYFHNAFTFLDTPISYGNQNFFISSLEKFVIGLINSLFLFLPSSTAHIITLRRFVMQGLEAGFISGLGTIAGNIFWISSIILGWRFFVIPWLSLDIFRYFLGFILLIKYMWDCYNEKRIQIVTNSNTFLGITYSQTSLKIFLLNFLLALTEQTCFYPFLTNISISPESSILESFPAQNFSSFIFIHLFYIGGLLIGSLSLLHFSCWFWENPAFKIYMWFISSASANPALRASTSSYYKIINFVFLYLTMICAISSIPYYGLDYLITNPLGLISEDRILNSSNDKKQILEFSFLNSKASDKNTRRNRGRHGRRERWKRRIRKYRTFDATLYDQGVYDLFTIEDLNYGFDRFWLRRKMRNHRVRFRFFPGPWMRSFKKQLAKPRLESSTGPRSEFFRILFEQVYHPTFHSTRRQPTTTSKNVQFDLFNYLNPSPSIGTPLLVSSNPGTTLLNPLDSGTTASSMFSSSIITKDTLDAKLLENQKTVDQLSSTTNKNYNSILRKFVRKFEKRLKTNQIGKMDFPLIGNGEINENQLNSSSNNLSSQKIYSKRWKQLFSIYFSQKSDSLFGSQKKRPTRLLLNTEQNLMGFENTSSSSPTLLTPSSKITLPSELNLSKKEKQIYRYKSLFKTNLTKQKSTDSASNQNLNQVKIQSQTLLHPIKFYLQQEQAFERKLRYYSPTLFRTFSVENNAPYFRIMMKKYFYHYKPTLRWKKTMKVASLRKARRKTSRLPRKFNFSASISAEINTLNKTREERSFESARILERGTNLLNSTDSALRNELNSPSETGKTTSSTTDKQAPLSLLRLQKPTHSYSIVSKKATRYRSKIYRDVLQHWYYTPFNRLLLKFDVDSFIKRQPFSHFLTKKEENLLHLKRYLLSEHYDTLRWYTYMQHYRSMKNKIGGTKSFASKTYNQQFAGTFKKIRHLFAITPNQTQKMSSLEGSQEKTIIKFDQLLYNEPIKGQKASKIGSVNSLGSRSYLLEELQPNLKQSEFYPAENKFKKQEQSAASSKETLSTELIAKDSSSFEASNSKVLTESAVNSIPVDNIDNALLKLSHSLNNFNPIRKESIKKMIEKKGSVPLAQFFNQKDKGQEQSLTSYKPLLNGSSSSDEQLKIFKENEPTERIDNVNFARTLNAMLMTSFLKKYKKNLSDQDFLKAFLTRKIEKFEKRKKQKEKHLEARLALLKNWLVYPTKVSSFAPDSKNVPRSNDQNVSTVVTSGLQKAFYKGLIDPTLDKKIENPSASNSQLNLGRVTLFKNKVKYQILSKINYKLNTREKDLYKKLTIQTLKNFANLTQEKQILISIQTLSNLTESIKTQKGNSFATSAIKKPTQNLSKLLSFVKNQLISLKVIKSTTQNLYKTKFNLLRLLTRKNKATAIRKQKRLRKVFKKMKLKKLRKSTILTNSNNSLLKQISLQTTKSQKLNEVNALVGSNASFLPKEREILVTSKELTLQKNNSSDSNEVSPFYRKKRDYTQTNFWEQNKNWKEATLQSDFRNEKSMELNRDNFENQNTFKRKRSPGRRAISNFRRSRARGIIKKRLLPNKELINKIKKISKDRHVNLPSNTSEFVFKKENPLKTRRSKIKKHRFWRTTKRTKYSQKYRKYRKTTQDIIGKIRVISKQKQKIQTKVALQKWWTDNFLPNLQANTNILWQLEKDKQIENKLNELADGFNRQDLYGFNPLPIESNSISSAREAKAFNSSAPNVAAGLEAKNFVKIPPANILPFYAGWDESLRKFVITNRLLSRREAGYSFTKQQKIEKNSLKSNLTMFEKAPLQGMNAATTLYWQIPFTTYDPDQFFALGMDGFSPIGWRRFQFRHTILKNWITSLSNVTNNKLTEQVETLGEIPTALKSSDNNSLNDVNSNKKNFFVINKTLVSNTINSNNSVGMFGASDLRSKELPKLQGELNSNLRLGKGETIKQNYLIDNMVRSFDNKQIFMGNNQTLLQQQNKFQNKKNFYRRLKKRYRKVKKHPRPPVWFPSGPLLNQVLPVHYIYVFYKRNRLPKERYLKRRLLKGKKENSLIKTSQTNINKGNFDFTLRRRIKPKRKYHRKPLGQTKGVAVGNITESKKVEPRRLKFLKEKQSPLIYERPYSSTKKYKENLKQATTFGRSSQKTKKTNVGDNSNMLRVRQLRRRMQRQIFRPVWRYKPRAGGFVWPGDYLKLELIKAPLLNTTKTTKEIINQGDDSIINRAKAQSGSSSKVNNKLKRKKKRTIQEWQIQPKRYLLEKHNLKVLKKKLEKSNRINNSSR